MRRNRAVNLRLGAWVLAILLASLAGGCQSASTRWLLRAERESQDQLTRGRGVATQTCSQRRLNAYVLAKQGSDDAGAELPWWASRNDERATAVVGYRSPTYQSAVTLTYDRQYNTSRGRAVDHYNSTTYRLRAEETAH